MTPKDLLLKEYDSAWQHLMIAKESKQKTIRLFLAIMAAMVAFLVKGDLPLKTLAYIPAIELMFLTYLVHQIFNQTCASNAFHVVEEKINQHIKNIEEYSYKYDLTQRIRYLREGDGMYLTGLIARIVIIVSLLVSSVTCLHVGLNEYAVSEWTYWLLMLGNIIALLTIGVIHHIEAKGRKRRHKEIVASILQLESGNT